MERAGCRLAVFRPTPAISPDVEKAAQQLVTTIETRAVLRCSRPYGQ